MVRQIEINWTKYGILKILNELLLNKKTSLEND